MSDFEDGFDLNGVSMVNYKNPGIVYAFVLSVHNYIRFICPAV